MENEDFSLPIVENPKYLYQYTSIDTLALILKNKTIKFNSLKNVDDVEESQASDIKDFGKFTYTSCWTYDDAENLALWNMYTEKMKGVRIKLPYDCLIENKNYLIKELEKSNLDLITYYSYILTIDGHKKDEKMRSYQLRDVEYTNQQYKLYPKILDNRLEPNVIKLGLHKRKQWEFQKEYRHLIYTCPLEISNLLKKRNDIKCSKDYINLREIIIQCFEKHDKIPEGLFLDIDKDCFNEMEIMLGPKTTESDKIIVESLIKEYNPKAKLVESNFRNKIR
ncbi:DUF2971 domain-containing protein [Clostridium butyricum]|uniref:DUF2971 domain-containing protein n=1 Tax=Clostridium butyricum TaxID=1492 RepID=UPI002AB00B60|nr:DUF2971 domain-containing protein [Clostridium butyricum]